MGLHSIYFVFDTHKEGLFISIPEVSPKFNYSLLRVIIINDSTNMFYLSIKIALQPLLMVFLWVYI